ncbi:T9SS C-terminal target domain-containing protein [Salmonirosea aquatica]|uniref:T9SS C-terminal target domain-containing protein n=1 Tax=Salmonirosea aquatica TaxID=2654236 RepID=A0A7C9BHN1_9BACT|nr:T9SS C-terminal target domain-containing protein [Cytophagaceae bacterium SJW1-29]
MKKVTNLIKVFIFGALVAGFTACNDKGTDPDPDPTPTGPSTISGSITTNTTWTAGNQYILSGFVYVEDGATLTIEPGTIIKGEKSSKGSLIVKRGGKIIANGTVDKPIVFTSNQAKGQRAAGDWGGLVLLGKAPVNKADARIEGENISEFGGTDPADNSGSLKYVRIEFAGIAFETDKEINGLTFGGVGSGTTVDYVQVSYSGDDSYEWFGGTVNAKHLIAYRGLDDDFDTDNGYSGMVQYGLIIRDPAVADQAGDSNAFESDNDATGTEAMPKTAAKFANVTATIAPGTLDSKYNTALRLRRSSELKVYNSVFSAPYKIGVLLQNASVDNYKSGKLVLQGIALQGATKMFDGVDETLFNTAANKNKVYTSVADLMLDSNFNSISVRPVGIPKAGSPLLTGGVTLPSGFEAAPYIGAFNTTDWTATWANFDPQNTDYDTAK